MSQITTGNATIDARYAELLQGGFSFVLLSVPIRLQIKFTAPPTVGQRGAWSVFEGTAELSAPFGGQARVRLAIDPNGRYELRFVLGRLESVLDSTVLPRLSSTLRATYDRLVRPYVAFYRDCEAIVSSHVGEDPALGAILAGINFYCRPALGEIEPTRTLCKTFPAAGLEARRFVLHLGCVAAPGFTFVVQGNFDVDAEIGTPAIVLDRIALRVDQDSSSVLASASVSFAVRVGGETLVFTGGLGVDSRGAAVISGSLDAADGAWKDPFGARGVTLGGVGVQLMAAPTAPFVGVGLRARVMFGSDRISAGLALLFDPSAPDKAVLQLEVPDRVELRRLLGGVVDPQFVPTELLDVALDDLQIHISPSGGLIAGKEYEPGFHLRGAVELWGLRASVDGALSYAAGGHLRGAFSPVIYPASGALVDIHGDPGKGPSLDIGFNAVQRGGRAVGSVKIVGLYNHQFEAIVEAHRLKLALGRTKLGIYTGGSIELAHGRVTLTSSVGFRAKVKVALGAVEIELDTEVLAAYAATVTADAISQPIRFVFDACGAKLDLDVNAGALRFTEVESMARFFVEHSGRVAQEILAELAAASLAAITWLRQYVPDLNQAAMVMRQANAAAARVADGFRQIYAASAESCATALRVAAYSPQAIAGAMKSAYAMTEQQVGQLLKTIGMSASDIARAMRRAFGWSAEQTAEFFDDVLDFSDKTTKAALDAAGYAASEIEDAMKDVYGWTSAMWDDFMGLF